MKKIQDYLHYIELSSEVEDFDKIHAEIKKGIVFKGTNLWILVFAIVIASVGLNMNSTAVIIGAMLISPLMGPINGIGYSIATYNIGLFKLAIKNFGFAVITGLVASTVYFALSPVSTAHSEILARTSPTIYDVLIALFGGLAGIVAISSKLKGNVIPGVAIATALMPPLCTAGYGLGTGQFNFFFGAFYLFTINTVFIALSSVIISQVLKFPIRTVIDPIRKKRVNQYIYAVIIATLLPSIYFGYVLVQNEKFSEKALTYVKNITVFEGGYLLKNEINANKRTIHLIYGGNALARKSRLVIKERAKDFDLDTSKIIIVQGFAINENSINENEILQNKLNSQLNLLRRAKERNDSIINRPLLGQQILSEINPLFPQIKTCSFSETILFADKSAKPEKIILVVFTASRYSLKSRDKEKITNWLKARIKTLNIKVYFEV
jgi:uncharacterized hydrophobic protein (TIGR00271 family)